MDRDDRIVAAVLVLFILAAFGSMAFIAWQQGVTKRACIEAGHDPLVCEAEL